MKGRIQMIHGDQDRDLGNEDQRGMNTVSNKGNTQGYTETTEEIRKDKDKMKTRQGRGRGVRTRTIK